MNDALRRLKQRTLFMNNYEEACVAFQKLYDKIKELEEEVDRLKVSLKEKNENY